SWWRSQNIKRRFIWPGIAAYRIGSTPTFTSGEIADQIRETRTDPLTDGAIYFSQKSLRNDLGGIQKELRENVYTRNALTPRFSWIRTGEMHNSSAQNGPNRATEKRFGLLSMQKTKTAGATHCYRQVKDRSHYPPT